MDCRVPCGPADRLSRRFRSLRLGSDADGDSESDFGPDPENVITDVTVLTQRLEIDIDRGEQIVTYDESHDDIGSRSRRLPCVIAPNHIDLLEFSRELPDRERVDESHYQVTFIRVPVSFESPPSGSGRGWSSRCELPTSHPGSDTEPTEVGGNS